MPYQGSCHCGNVRYEVDMAMDGLITCNCSICRRNGFILGFVSEGSFKLLAGEGETTEYRFAKRHIAHKFCKTCGVQSFATGETPDGKTMIAVNVRCLEGVDLDALTPNTVDGASL